MLENVELLCRKRARGLEEPVPQGLHLVRYKILNLSVGIRGETLASEHMV
jgi:hypothetical protein